LWAGASHITLAVVAVAAVLGHDFSLFLRFRGGKGVATTLGVALVLAPVPTVLALVVWVVTMVIGRYSSLASLLALATLPLAAVATATPGPYVAALFALFLLGVLKHYENIIRLLRGQERKFVRVRPADGA
jgi:glycerol-3-phosphate acyltransferase PlsY